MYLLLWHPKNGDISFAKRMLKTGFNAWRIPVEPFWNQVKVIVCVDGTDLKGVIVPYYDIKDLPEFNKRFIDLINTEVELSCHPIKLSKLEAEEDTSGIDFSALEKFIVNDI